MQQSSLNLTIWNGLEESRRVEAWFTVYRISISYCNILRDVQEYTKQIIYWHMHLSADICTLTHTSLWVGDNPGCRSGGGGVLSGAVTSLRQAAQRCPTGRHHDLLFAHLGFCVSVLNMLN
jgi:hypothetical protein